MAARVDQLCDQVKAVIEAAARVRPLAGTEIVVTCDPTPDIDGDTMAAGRMQVVIWWGRHTDAESPARGVDARDYEISILAVEKCGDAGRVPNNWLRERTEWVEECVRRPLANARERLDGAYPLTEGDVELDREELVERWLFWTVVSITYRDEREV